MNNECPFCKISLGLAPATVVYEDDATLAFFPDTPATPGHTLVIPKIHVPDYFAAPSDVLLEVSATCQRVGKGLRRALALDGLNLITSAGEAATQSVFHLHIHVVPRMDDDDFGDIWPPKKELPRQVEDHLAASLREAVRLE